MRDISHKHITDDFSLNNYLYIKKIPYLLYFSFLLLALFTKERTFSSKINPFELETF